MRKLTSQGEQAVADLSARYGVSTDAVRTMLEAIRLGNGTMAQFSHPELGGRGQWMAGGMTMVGDMFNHSLQATVSGLASELSGLLATASVYMAAPDPATVAGPGLVHQVNLDSWWPGELGRPGSSGSQDDSRYAVFPQARRLAVQSGGGAVRVYDTLDHAIGGVQQQQGGLPGTLSFTSQRGTFTVESLPLVTAARMTPPAPEPAGGTAMPPEREASAGTGADVVLAALERLGDLHQRGILTDEEFAAKKAELLSRL
jgi:Short C-terminal domain